MPFKPFGILSWLSKAARLVFFIRYALMTPALPMLIAAYGWYDLSNPVLGNVLLVDNQTELFNLTWISLVAVALSFVEARVALLNARERFSDCPFWAVDRTDISRFGLVIWVVAWLVAGLCLPLVCALATHYGTYPHSVLFSQSFDSYGYGIFAGICFAALLMLLASALGHLRRTANTAHAELLPTDLFFRNRTLLRDCSCSEQYLARILVNTKGYADKVTSPGVGEPNYRFAPGHGQLAFTLLLAIIGYVFLYWRVSEPEGGTFSRVVLRGSSPDHCRRDFHRGCFLFRSLPTAGADRAADCLGTVRPDFPKRPLFRDVARGKEHAKSANDVRIGENVAAKISPQECVVATERQG